MHIMLMYVTPYCLGEMMLQLLSAQKSALVSVQTDLREAF